MRILNRVLLHWVVVCGTVVLTSCEKKEESAPTVPDIATVQIVNLSNWKVKIGILNQEVQDDGGCSASGRGYVSTLTPGSSTTFNINPGSYLVAGNNSSYITTAADKRCWNFGWNDFENLEAYKITISDDNVVQESTPPNGASNIQVTKLSNYILISWSDNSTNEEGFILSRRIGSANGTYSEIGRVGSNIVQYKDYNVSAGIYYCYDVIAYNSAGPSFSTGSPACVTK